MARFLGARFVRAIFVFLLVSLGNLFLIDLTPGDPAVSIAGETAGPDVLAAVREQYGFDRPLLVRWVDWMGSVFSGNFGQSFTSRMPVMSLLADRLPVTVELTILAVLITLALVIPLALYAGYHQGSWLDRFVNGLSAVLISIPSFVLALVLILVFALALRVLPVSGWVPLAEDPIGNLRSAILPALALALAETAVLLPVLRADVVATLEQDYITLARSKGVSSARILFRHALRPSSTSLVTLMGLSLARLFGGAVIVETAFSLPGIGDLLITSIRSKDLILTQGLVMFIAVVYLVANLVIDILYTKLDPRVSVSS
jgi:peptide/nickel transport system permease protein